MPARRLRSAAGRSRRGFIRICFGRGALPLLGLAILAGPGVAPVRAEPPPLVVYCSADEAFARPILAEFTRRTGREVRPLFDTEAGKTTGLVHRLLAERGRPRADVWWSSEIFGTIQLAEAGVLTAYEPAGAGEIPSPYRDATRRWTAFGLRARVIAYNPEKTPADRLPRTWADLARPEFKGRIAMANPIFGTTRGHLATLHAQWGTAQFRAYLEALRANGVRLADGNSHAVLLVARGEVELAATDTDDVIVARARGDAIAMAFPNLDSPDGRRAPGTLWIPNSAGLVSGGPAGDGARALVDYLVSAGVEQKLAESESANLPVRPASWEGFSRLASAQSNGATRANESSRRGALLGRFVEEYRRGAPADFAAGAARLRETDALVREILLR